MDNNLLNVTDVRVGYQNANTTSGFNSQPSIDRARGGIIRIRLVLPSLTRRTNSRRDSFTIPQRVCEFEIDLEQMPLVNVATYAVEEVQIAPEQMPYPNGVTNPFTGTFNP
jgi:hypothetical protein